MEAWRTYTPDGRMLEVEHRDGVWAARCGGSRCTASSALEAIAGVIGPEASTIGSVDPALESWLVVHAEQLEREAG